MGRGKRAEITERKLNIKKVAIVAIVFLLIAACIILLLNKNRISELFKQEEEISFEEENISEEKTKTIDDILSEFGGEVLEQPKIDTYFVSKEGKIYTIYADGEIVEEKVSFWNGENTKPNTDKNGNININSPEELKWVADQVIKGEENFSGVTITIQKNLDFGARIKEDGTWEGHAWTSIIGFLDELPETQKENKEEDTEKENLKRFAGTLNGNGFSIRGIYIDENKNYQGLIGYSTGKIENLTLKNSYISGNDGTGAIVGLNGGTVKNCVTINTIVSGKENKVGGIVGISMASSTISQCCTEKGSVAGKQYVAGIAGYVNNNAVISDCSNSAKISGEDYVGGISGIVFYGTTIKSNNNNGKINGKNYTGGIVGYSEAQIENVYNEEEIEGQDFVGGIAGANVEVGDVSKSYNKGNITGNNNVGGIVGTNNASTYNCYNIGSIKAKGYRAGGICGQNATESFIYNSYNIGKVEGNDSIGGVVGGDFGSVTNCYYLNTILENVQSEQSKTEEELKNNIGDLGQEFSSDTKQINQGYPILGWQM